MLERCVRVIVCTCPHVFFCSATAEEAWVITDDAVAVPHSDPLANCHMVVAPRRHVLTFYDLDVQEQQVVWGLVGEIQKRIASALKVDGFHVGFADGTEAHPIHAHIHVVPRSPETACGCPLGSSGWIRSSRQSPENPIPSVIRLMPVTFT